MGQVSLMLGKRFGRLTVIRLGTRNGTVYFDRVICDCGTEKNVRRSDLQSGRTISCGCIRRENATKLGLAARTHGHSGSPMYQLWHTMIARCHNPTHTAYRYYGARGIKVCTRWRESFDAFVADMGARPHGLQLDRIDPDGDYAPGNVRWADIQTQLLNRRLRSPGYRARTVVWEGETHTIADLAKRAGTNYGTLYARLERGMAVEDALALRPTSPV